LAIVVVWGVVQAHWPRWRRCCSVVTARCDMDMSLCVCVCVCACACARACECVCVCVCVCRAV
jgi:hypothetical protein